MRGVLWGTIAQLSSAVCQGPLDTLHLVNDKLFNDGGTKDFRVSVSLSPSGPWTQVSLPQFLHDTFIKLLLLQQSMTKKYKLKYIPGGGWHTTRRSDLLPRHHPPAHQHLHLRQGARQIRQVRAALPLRTLLRRPAVHACLLRWDGFILLFIHCIGD